MGPDRKTLRRLVTENEGNRCFACGHENPHGLHMTFYTDEQVLYSWVQPPEHMCGWENIVHGGIQGTILDEIMGWGAAFFTKRIALTKQNTVSFKKPVLQDQGELLAECRILNRLSEREVVMEARIYQGDFEPCVTSQGTFGLFKIEDVRRLGLMDETSISLYQKAMEQM
ncbi:MAG: PaaI family thioesterase [Dehalococcoidia bacterium]|nr:PaaI family thioesterase [Dehalococcoidia bacterium]